MSLIAEIAAKRRQRLSGEGHAQGLQLPRERAQPPIPFSRDPFLICELKRRSPSRGDIAPGLDPVAQARRYAEAGVQSISVLTEEAYFGGSLKDLVSIKRALPQLSVLRKDFLLDEEDVRTSGRAGADAILLIASLLDAGLLRRLHELARGLGMEVLVEAHDLADVEKIRALAPPLTGINCRDLADFTVDLLHPLALRSSLNWPTRLVFESGIRTEEDALVALAGGFRGLLVGETVVRDPSAAGKILAAVRDGQRAGKRDFWGKLARRRRPARPLVKVCGITREEDALLADSLGADILGFVFAPSPRQADPRLLERLVGVGALKAGVVVTSAASGGGPRGSGEGEGAVFARRIARLLSDGLLDAVQFHGEEAAEDCLGLAFPYYKAVRLGGPADLARIDSYRSPRVLVDAFSPRLRGGTGARVPTRLVEEARRGRLLWLAGGVAPGNIGEIMRRFSPELVDASSGLEKSPGVKDSAKLESFFREIERHAHA